MSLTSFYQQVFKFNFSMVYSIIIMKMQGLGTAAVNKTPNTTVNSLLPSLTMRLGQSGKFKATGASTDKFVARLKCFW
jgi:hypothetical protein